jgi:hypothetical protein
MKGMGGMGDGQDGGHMVRCPLCGGAGVVPAEVAEQVAPPPGPDPVSAHTTAMMGKGRGGGRGGGGGGGGGHGGHGGM